MSGSASRKRIALVVNALTHGGAEIQVSRLARGFVRRGWGVSVISMIPPEEFVDELASAGVRVHSLNMTPGVPNPAAIFRLRRILSDFRPTVVHSHIAHANILSRVTRAVGAFPVLICTAHNTNEGGRALMWAYRWTDWLADLTTNVSESGVRRQIEQGAVPSGRVMFVPNGLDVEQFRPDPGLRESARAALGAGGAFVWLAAGRFEEAKDYPNLLRAFAAVDAGESDPLLLIAGRGTLEAEVKALAESLGVAPRVRFLGVRSDMPGLMNAADGYVMSSRWEGMPLVLQEAAAVALPVVATDVGGNREVVREGQSGLLVPANDSAALAAAMRQVMEMPPEARAEMGRRGRQHVEARFGLDHVLDRWESIYRDLLDRKGLPRCA